MPKRREELLNLVKESDRETAAPLIDKMIFLELKLEELQRLPMIRVNPRNPEQQKVTPAAKQYKEFLQQYTNILKIVLHLVGSENTEEDSPLRAWADMHLKKDSGTGAG